MWEIDSEPEGHTHASTKGAGFTVCDSKNARANNVCACNINIIKILLQPHANPVSWKGVQRLVEKRLVSISHFGTFIPVQESLSQSCATPTTINVVYEVRLQVHTSSFASTPQPSCSALMSRYSLQNQYSRHHQYSLHHHYICQHQHSCQQQYRYHQ